MSTLDPLVDAVAAAMAEETDPAEYHDLAVATVRAWRSQDGDSIRMRRDEVRRRLALRQRARLVQTAIAQGANIDAIT